MFRILVSVLCVLFLSGGSVAVDLTEEISEVEAEYDIPEGLLLAIANVESKMKPFAVNAKKRTHYFKTKSDAVNFVKQSLKCGYRNISVGCLQLLYVAHKHKFGHSIERMLEPKNNIRYAAKFLKTLYKRYGSWEKAVKKYHSNIECKSVRYLRKVKNNFGRAI